MVEEDGLCGHFYLCPRRGIVDTSNQIVSVRVAGAKKRRRSVEERSALRLEAERARSQLASQAQQIGYFSSRIEEAAAEKSRVESRAVG